MSMAGTSMAMPGTSRRVVRAGMAAGPTVRAGWSAACAASVAIGVTTAGAMIAGLALAVVGMLLATAALVDAHELRLPNRLLAVATVSAMVAAAALERVWPALVGGLLGGGLMLAVRVARGVGMGDVKMAGVVGAGVAAHGLIAAPVAIAVAAFTAASAGLLLRRKRLPLGPALWIGWAAALLVPVEGWLS